MSKTAPFDVAQDAKLAQTAGKVQELKMVMVDVVNKLADRGDKLEQLNDRAADLNIAATQFQHRAKRAKCAIWWQKCRLQLAVLFVLLIVALVVFLVVCFSGANKCI